MSFVLYNIGRFTIEVNNSHVSDKGYYKMLDNSGKIHFCCTSCHKKFRRECSIDYHVRRKCKKFKKYKCDECRENMGSKDKLVLHWVNVHGIMKFDV